MVRLGQHLRPAQILTLAVFLGDNNSVKLGDFGLSKIIASHDFASTYVGTPFYMSPEICAAERYSHYSDIWSLGCIIYELATRQVPFEARSHMELVMKIKQGRIKPLPPGYSKELSDAIQSCLRTDPRQRPDCSQLLSVPNIKVARTRLETATALGQYEKVQTERDSALNKLAAAHKQIQELQAEVTKLRESNKKVEMEWHARATLAIDQKVHEASEKHKQELLTQFNKAVDQRAEEKLNSHLASLPSSHHNSTNGSDGSAHVRSSTPPPSRSAVASFETFIRTIPDTDASSLPDVLEDSVLDTDLTALSLNDPTPDPEEEEDKISPLARRTAKLPPPKRATRKPLSRAKTATGLTNFRDETKDSPMDVHMADPSPMPTGRFVGLGLSPRRAAPGQDLSPRRNAPAIPPLKRNIFSQAAEKENRAPSSRGIPRGRTLVELSSQSPAKWNPMMHGEDMPSPFIKKR